MREGRIPVMRFDAVSATNLDPDDAWECADCGWNIDSAHLVPGWSIAEARDTHSEKYCARPPVWP